MSAPPRKPCRRQTFALEIDPDQILLDVGDYDYDYDDDVGTTLQHPDSEAPSHSSNNNNDRLSRPPRQPSRRSTVRVGLDPDQLEAFEEWRTKHAALLQDDSVVDVEFSADDLSSSVMDMTIDSTILSWVDNTHGPNVTSSSANSSNSSSAPPRQPRRRSTLIVTLGQPPQGLHKLDDPTNVDEDDAVDDTSSFNYGESTTAQGGASFSEDSHATSVFVELFCKKVLEEQRKFPPSSNPSSSRRRGSARRAARPSPRASLRLRGPVRQLRQLMLPELERIESVGTVLDDDDDNDDGTPENSTRNHQSPLDLIDDDPSDSVLAGARSSATRKHDTHPVAPVRALSHQSAASSVAANGSTNTSCLDGGSSGPSNSSSSDSRRPLTAEPVRDGRESSASLMTATSIDHHPIQPCRRATLVNPSALVPGTPGPDDDDEGNKNDSVVNSDHDLPNRNDRNDSTSRLSGSFGTTPTTTIVSLAPAVAKDKVMRESLQTVATEVSWESQDDDDDEYNDQDEGDEECSTHDVEAEPHEGLHYLHHRCHRPSAATAVRGVQ